jgi:hypothetical protein
VNHQKKGRKKISGKKRLIERLSAGVIALADRLLMG